MKSVAFFPHQPSGCYWYRTEHPMKTLEANGIPITEIHLDDDIDISNIQSFHFYGATPFSLEKILKFLKEEKIKIVYDIDDMFELIDESNINYHAVKRDIGSFNQMIEYADEITVSTPYIKELVAKKTTTKITVLPNCYIPEEWAFNRVPHEEIRIGFAGSSTHVQDLIEIIPAIKNLQSKYNIKFYIMGFGQDTYEKWFRDFRYAAPEKGKLDLIELDKRLKEIKFEWVPFVNYKLYPKVLTELSLDIGLCPLKDTEFNRCRSASKAMEYTLAGALVLSSDIEPYREKMSDSIFTSLLIKDNNWEKYIEDGIQMISVVENGLWNKTYNRPILNWLKENRTMQSQVDLLKSIYTV